MMTIVPTTAPISAATGIGWEWLASGGNAAGGEIVSETAIVVVGYNVELMMRGVLVCMADDSREIEGHDSLDVGAVEVGTAKDDNVASRGDDVVVEIDVKVSSALLETVRS